MMMMMMMMMIELMLPQEVLVLHPERW